MKRYRIIGAIVLIVVVIISIMSPCFAAGTAMTAIDIWSTAWGVYCSSRGMKQYFTSDGVYSNFNNQYDNRTARVLYDALFGEYNSVLDSSDQMTVSDWVSTVLDLTTSQLPNDAGAGPKTAFALGAATVEWFDGFATWLLSTKLGQVSDSGVYHSSGNFSDSILYNHVGQNLYYLTPNVRISIATGRNGNSRTDYIVTSDTGVYCFNYSMPANSFGIGFVSNDPSVVVRSYSNMGTTTTYSLTWNASYGCYFVSIGGYQYNYTSLNSNLPYFNSVEDAVGVYVSGDPDTSVLLKPDASMYGKVKDKNGNTLPDGDIYIPDLTDPAYVPDVIYGGLNIPYVDESDRPLDDLLNAVRQLILSNEKVLAADEPLPDPVISPIVPFQLPSFSFNFSGIWYYVVNWINSLRSGFSFIASTWAALPFAMVIPIYATAVIVIVVGTFKRFFS